MSDQHTDDTTVAPKAPAAKQKYSLLDVLFVILASLLAFSLIGVGVAYGLISKSYSEIEQVSLNDSPEYTRPAPPPPPEEPRADSPLNILLLGSDARKKTDLEDPGDEILDARSDAIMVVQLSADRKHVTVMSIMRDSYVEIPGQGEAKINAAIALGGIPLAVNTVENVINTRIDHVAVVDFSSFKKLTDAVGGVTVDNEVEFVARHGGQTFKEGKVELDGRDALSFVRERYSFIDGDYQRARNQQAYMKGLTKKLLSKDTLGSPEKVLDVFNAMKPYLIVDDELGLATAVSIGMSLRDIRSDDITFFTAPTLGVDALWNGEQVVVLDQDELAKITAALENGTLHEYAETRTPGSELPDL